MSAQQPAHPADGTTPSRLWPYLLLTLAPLFWSGNIVVSRALRADISPVALTFWRWVVALAILLPVTWVELRRSWPVIRRRWKILVLLGLLGVFLYQMLAYQALALTTALNVLLISATAPLFIALVGWLGFGERITLRLALAIALSLLGVGVVITRGDWALLRQLRLNPGDLFMLAAVLVWAIYSNLLKRRPRELSQFALLATTAVTGMAFTLPVYLWQRSAGVTVAWSPATIMAVLYIGIFASVLAYVAWNQGVSLAGANKAGLFINLMPLFGGALAMLFLAERPDVAYGVGALLVFAGLALGASAPARRTRSNSAPS